MSSATESSHIPHFVEHIHSSSTIDFPSEIVDIFLRHSQEIWGVMRAFKSCIDIPFLFDAGYDICEPLEEAHGLEGYGKGHYSRSNKLTTQETRRRFGFRRNREAKI